jgi:hypothetical protein
LSSKRFDCEEREKQSRKQAEESKKTFEEKNIIREIKR